MRHDVVAGRHRLEMVAVLQLLADAEGAGEADQVLAAREDLRIYPRLDLVAFEVGGTVRAHPDAALVDEPDDAGHGMKIPSRMM
ncbi:MAG: hypothetical protein E5W06_00275 [Mesorhizobium sp.]|nr:MAG: hypothetical protein E5W06_00275 [Mesorhizobium sp.]